MHSLGVCHQQVFDLQGLQASLGSLSDAHLAATVVSLRHLCEEVVGAQGITVAPPVDQSVVPGRYADVMGLQKDRFKQAGPPQSKHARPKRATVKSKVTVLPRIVAK